jgi:16S rRNA processing protein RimM
VRIDRGALIISFYGINSREEAALFRKAVIEVQEKNLPPLPENTFYHRQIIGLIVVTPEGREIGQITEIIETGSNDVYVVNGQEKEYLIPAIKDVISCIDFGSGTLTIAPMKGLLD